MTYNSMTEKEKYIILVDNDNLQKSDAIILLEGDGLNRVRYASELFHSGYSDKIVFSGSIYSPGYGSYPGEVVIPEIEKLGIPGECIIYENKSQNTREQAIEVFKIASEKEWKRLIIVASHYHQYRAFLTFLRVWYDIKSDIELLSAPVKGLPWFHPTEWGVRFELLEGEFSRIEKYKELGHIVDYKEGIKYFEWKEKRNLHEFES